MSTPGHRPHPPPEFAVNSFSRLAQNDFVRIALMAVLLAATVAFA
jgi:general stress protein CsbA